jgi:hypothetical protein
MGGGAGGELSGPDGGVLPPKFSFTLVHHDGDGAALSGSDPASSARSFASPSPEESLLAGGVPARLPGVPPIRP